MKLCKYKYALAHRLATESGEVGLMLFDSLSEANIWEKRNGYSVSKDFVGVDYHLYTHFRGAYPDTEPCYMADIAEWNRIR